MKPSYISTISLLVLILITSCTNEIERTRQVKKKSPPEKRYSGKIKKIIEYDCQEYWANQVPIKIAKESCVIYNIKEFNEDEVLLKEQSWYDLDYPNTPGFSSVVKLNEKGLIIEEISKQTGMMTFDNRTTFSYNADGFETEKVIYKKGKLYSRWLTEYDEYNCAIKESKFDENNSLNYYYVSQYDDLNREIKLTYFESNDSIKYYKLYQYKDTTDSYTKKTKYDSRGKILKVEDVSLLKSQNKIDGTYMSSVPDSSYQDIEYYVSGEVRSWHYLNYADHDVYNQYDRDGRITEIKILRNKEWLDTYSWKYRDDGIVEEEAEATSRVVGKTYYKKTTYYRLDDMGNWLEKYIIDSDGRVMELEVRSVEYYTS